MPRLKEVCLQTNLGPVSGVILGTVTLGTLAPYANNSWNPGFYATATLGSLPADFAPVSVAINGVQCEYQAS